MKSWSTKPFLNVCDFQGGTQPPKSTFTYKPSDGYIRLVQIRDYESDDHVTFVPATAKLKTCLESDVMIARYGASIGRILRGKAGAYNVALVKTLPDESQLTKDFLFHWLNAPFFQGYLARVANRAAQAGFNKEDFAHLEMPVPPLAEQGRIVELLDEADKLRKLRAQADSRTASLLPALFHEMFGDPLTNNKKWPTHRLGEVAQTTSGGTPDRKNPEYYGGDVPWVKSGELHQYEVTSTQETLTRLGLEKSSAKIMPVGTILLALYGATVGALSRLAIKAATNQAVCCISPGPALHTDYLMGAIRLLTPHLLKQRVGGAQPNISQGIVRALSIQLPPLPLQTQFGALVAEIRAVQAEQDVSRHRLSDLFNSTFHHAFNGEL